MVSRRSGGGHLVLHPLEENPFLGLNMRLQTFQERWKSIGETVLGILLEGADLDSHVFVFVTQLMHEVHSISQSPFYHGKEVCFFHLEVPSQLASVKSDDAVELLPTTCGPRRPRRFQPTEDHPFGDHQSIVVIV